METPSAPPPPPPISKAPSVTKLSAPSSSSSSSSTKPPSALVARTQATLSWRTARGDRTSFEMEIAGVKIDLEQKKCGEVSGLGTGPTVWDCALVLGKHLEKKYPLGSEIAEKTWNGKTVIELGSGTGVIGIICSLLFKGARFVLTDQEPLLPLIQRNIDLNKPNIPALSSNPETMSVQVLNWGEPVDHIRPSVPFDWVIVSDCVYPNVPNALLVDAMRKVSGPHTKILLAYEHRQDACRKSFFSNIEPHFVMNRIPEEELDPRFMADDVEIYILLPKQQQ